MIRDEDLHAFDELAVEYYRQLVGFRRSHLRWLLRQLFTPEDLGGFDADRLAENALRRLKRSGKARHRGWGWWRVEQ